MDFSITKKPLPIPKKAHIPKREVRPDLILIKKDNPKPLKTSVKKAKNITPVYRTMPETKKVKISIKTVVAFVLFISLLSAGLHSIIYLASAERSSGEILGVATTAYSNLDTAGKNLEAQDFQGATDMFMAAEKNLSEATEKLNRFKILTWLVPKANSADHLLDGAQLLARAGQKLTGALSLYNDLVVSSKGIETANFATILTKSKADLEESLKLLNQANSHFAQATSVPDEYQSTLGEAKTQIGVLTAVLENMVAMEDLYLAFLGNQTKTYLLIFQNHDELRATGGFIGTYGVLKISDGAIKQLKIESIYNLDGSIYDQIAAPGPMQPDIKKWGIRDANWFADFSVSAKKLLHFYESGRETADGVISFTPQLFEDILKLIGPINMSQYNTTLNHENFQEVVQLKTSVEYDKKLNQPKKFLSDFAPILLDRLTNLKKEEWFSVLQMISQNFLQKDIMLYSAAPEVQQRIEDVGFGGRILDTPHDFLAVINSNLGGTKTDLEIKQSINLQTKINADGRIVNTLKITRNNTSLEQNKNYARILVPLGSELLSAEGFDWLPHFSSAAEGFAEDPDLKQWDQGQLMFDQAFTRTEAGKTEFAGWIVTEPATIQTVTLTYALPFKLDFQILSNSASYSLLYQKQSGVRSADFVAEWDLGPFKKIWNSDNINLNGNRASIKSDSTRDEYWSVLLTE